ncbi:hypothetical protein [Microbacterium sp.]|uniref:hypothetical protein n=1 Tax=Microbacterium sp. TaxID=51671 RepID=UPI0039E3EA0B
MLTFDAALRIAAEQFGGPFARDGGEDDGAFPCDAAARGRRREPRARQGGRRVDRG